MDLSTLDLKKTVNLPKTAFAMKANLPQTEPRILERWENERLYHQIREARAGREKYVLHDGPPYANGNIHMGTAFNKILKDFIVKSKTMSGFDAPYVPGWDCHGLPIEIKVDSELGSKKARMTASEIRAECRQYAAKFVDAHRRDFKRLGVLGLWEEPYLTMTAGYEAVIAGAFVDFLERGYIYKGLKPVNWCLRCRTALAEAEVEYENHSSPSIWVRFALTSPAEDIHTALTGRNVYGLIWTTTPWTIPANLGIAYHPKFPYSAVEVNGDVYLIATGLIQTVAGKCGWSSYEVLTEVAGEKLEGTIYRHPFLERDSIGILGDYVTLEQGTGAVHTAPGHGHEDYLAGLQYGLPTYCPVDFQGRFFHAEGAAGRLPEELIGKTVWEANPIVLEILTKAGALLGRENIEHSYPHCWRCHNATIFRATDQWFIGMDRNELRTHALEEIKRVRWMPAWGEERISNMIAARPDWCISRQRVWGVPILAFYCESCNEVLTDAGILKRVVDLFAQHTADIWYEKTASELTGPGVNCAKCGGAEFRKESDILDVWFDSGSSHLAVLREQHGLPWPSDLYLEGGDQYRGWFHSSLLVAVGLRGGSPYKSCATHGWVLDGEGRAMSKSLGNVIEPPTILKQYGADILRLWVASVEFTDDVRISETILARLSEAYRKIRNTFRYTLGNLDGFDMERDGLPAGELVEIDRWILVQAEAMAAQCRAWYESFEFHKVYQRLYNFATSDLSSLYFDVLKDRLYTTAPHSHARRSAQTALYSLTYAMARLVAPILSYTAEEVWSYFQKPAEAPSSIHLTTFPEEGELTEGFSADQLSQAANWNRLMPVREDVLKKLELARQEKFIGAPLEARVKLSANGDLYPLLREYERELPALFIVSQVELFEAGQEAPLTVEVQRAEGQKCERCWKYTQDVGSDPSFPTICAACAGAVSEIVKT